MNPALRAHYTRVTHLREALASANESLVARLRSADHHVAEAAPAGGGWSVAQTGWHVAAVTSRFAGLVSGEVAGAQPLPDGYAEREWSTIAAAIPGTLQASAAVAPPPKVTRDEAVAALEQSGVRMARALDQLTPERGGRFGVTHPLVGTITIYQLVDWAATHVERHARQVARCLGGPA